MVSVWFFSWDLPEGAPAAHTAGPAGLPAQGRQLQAPPRSGSLKEVPNVWLRAAQPHVDRSPPKSKEAHRVRRPTLHGAWFIAL